MYFMEGVEWDFSSDS